METIILNENNTEELTAEQFAAKAAALTGDTSLMENELTAEEIVFTNKLATRSDGSLMGKFEFLNTKIEGVAISRRQKAAIYEEYKETYWVDTLRYAKRLEGSSTFNRETNLTIK